MAAEQARDRKQCLGVVDMKGSSNSRQRGHLKTQRTPACTAHFPAKPSKSSTSSFMATACFVQLETCTASSCWWILKLVVEAVVALEEVSSMLSSRLGGCSDSRLHFCPLLSVPRPR